jgi:hypothetical protein
MGDGYGLAFEPGEVKRRGIKTGIFRGRYG